MPEVVRNDEVAALIENPPAPNPAPPAPPAKRDRNKFWHIVYRISAAVGAAGLILAAIVGVYTGQVAACTNTNLGARDAPNKSDRAAQDEFDKAQNDLAQAQVSAITGASSGPEVVSRLVVAAQREGAAYVHYRSQREADDALRAASPLGKC